MKRAFVFIALAAATLLFVACAAGTNDLVNTANVHGVVAGFWRGLWNGVIAPVTFIISLFNKNVQMYEVHNNGTLYNLGFLLGMMIIFGGGAKGSSAGRWKH